MFRRYRCQCEAAQKQSDWTCFASLSRKLRDAKACRHHQRDRVAGRMGQPFRLSQKPNIDGVIGKSDPYHPVKMPALSASPAISAVPIPCGATSAPAAETG